MTLFHEKVWGDNVPTKHVIWINPEDRDELVALLQNQGVATLKLERRGPQFVIEIFEHKELKRWQPTPEEVARMQEGAE